MIYLSQLDIFRLFMRALRRCNLPISYTEGFNPHPKISFVKALKLGIPGEIETAFFFEKEIDILEFEKVFSEQIPKDLKIITVETV